MLYDMTLLGGISVALTVLWAVCLCLGRKWAFALFAVAHCLLYVDCFALQNHYNFEVAAIMVGISAVAAVIRWAQLKKACFSKKLAIYLLISAVPAMLYLLVLI